MSNFTEKDYEIIADIIGKLIKEAPNNEQIEGIMSVRDRLTAYLVDDNERFDIARFNNRIASNLLPD